VLATLNLDNEKEIEGTENSLRLLGVKNIKVDSVQSIGRGCGDNLITAQVLNRQVFSKPIFSKIAYKNFWRNKSGHNCFLEQICVGANGDIYPCLAEREISYGNVKLSPLDKIFSSGKAREICSLSKDKIEVCRDCEYRYCCFDCRIRAGDFLKKNFHLKPWWCFYNPYKGEWEDKKSI